ncbi:hypothetical protein [Burkholderia sp. WSM2230]|uniref:hypothetical protein n=1 Tax=Burkholderia sp. WSM2230 TaxID=944435 RepID=UPI0003F4E351|nr:hypothetical protein [Burkholderia sp. WSM2230]
MQPGMQPESHAETKPDTQPHTQSNQQPDTPRANADAPEPTPEVKARNQPSGAHYVEPSPLGIESVVQTGVDQQTNPPRSNQHPEQTAEVPLGTGAHAEPAGGGGRASHKN